MSLQLSMRVVNALDPVTYQSLRFSAPGMPEGVSVEDLFAEFWKYTTPEKMMTTGTIYRKYKKYDNVVDKLVSEINGRKNNFVVVSGCGRGVDLPEWMDELVDALENDKVFQSRVAPIREYVGGGGDGLGVLSLRAPKTLDFELDERFGADAFKVCVGALLYLDKSGFPWHAGSRWRKEGDGDKELSGGVAKRELRGSKAAKHEELIFGRAVDGDEKAFAKLGKAKRKAVRLEQECRAQARTLLKVGSWEDRIAGLPEWSQDRVRELLSGEVEWE